MREDDLIIEVQRSMNCLTEDEEIRRCMVSLVNSGMSPEQVAQHTRELVIKYLLLTENY